MSLTSGITNIFQKYLPTPFTIAILLTLTTILLGITLTGDGMDVENVKNVLRYWQDGIWNTGLLVFGYQMMLVLILGHVLVLSRPMERLINRLTQYATTTSRAVVLVSVTTMLVSFFNWGLGLIFGAIIARKVGEHAQEHAMPINYPLIGAAGYVGLMVWHGGISGSAPLKVAEAGHMTSILNNPSPELLAVIPSFIPSSATIFSWWNLVVFGILLILIPLVLVSISKKVKPTEIYLPIYNFDRSEEKPSGAEKLDYSKILTWIMAVIILAAFFISYDEQLSHFVITPNMLNFFMLGMAMLLHGNFASLLNAVGEAIGGAAGILIQFPLYFGIMGIMKETGMVSDIATWTVSVASEHTLPVYTFFSSGLVNIFVPSGGGQWAIQGPVVIESAVKLGVPLNKAIMALAYGDQITNMLQPFWALPLLGITRLKAREILPYTLIMMFVGILVYVGALLLL